MTFQEFIKFYRRNWIPILINIVLVLILGISLVLTVFKPEIQNNIFYSISVQNHSGNAVISPFENLKAADQFTDSLVGWLKDPALLSSFNKSGKFSSLKINKQEKNNLQISYKTHDKKTGYNLYKQIKTSLNLQMKQYSKNSDFNFVAAISNFNQANQKNNYPLLILILLFLGLIIGISSAYIYELGSGKIISINQLKNEFRRAKIFYHSTSLDNSISNFPDAIIIKLGQTKMNDVKFNVLGKNPLIFFIY